MEDTSDLPTGEEANRKRHLDLMLTVLTYISLPLHPAEVRGVKGRSQEDGLYLRFPVKM